MDRLASKVAIVTGASSGLGRAIAVLYARHGASVICSDLVPSARTEIPGEVQINTDELIRNEGGKAVFVKADVGQEQEVENLVNEAVEKFGRIDIMVNNAGIAIESKLPNPIHTTSQETWDTTMRVNATSVFLGSKFAIRQMLKQEPHASGDRGWIVNISSIFGVVGGYDNPSYCASKGAVANLTRQIALDYANHRIHCNAICPGYVRTAIFVNTTKNMLSREVLDERHPFGGTGTADDIAKFALTLASEDAQWLTGQCIAVDGGYTAR
ncbi:MAG: hypothetical protein M1821_004826 [Bathelium mastoideum]|nr:MAG: hypothetical protein M1821_004826 [Bathelium mastoideum]